MMRQDFLTKAAYATLVGVFLGVVQTSDFFSLSIWMTAAYPGFLTVMVGWFSGSVAGLPSQGKTRTSPA